MKETILFELEYDKDRVPKIMVTHNNGVTTKVFNLLECRIPDFEEFPELIQVETLYRLFRYFYEDHKEAVDDVKTSIINSKNRSKFDQLVMDQYSEIVKKWQAKKPGKYWEEAHFECAKFSKENHPEPIYLKISRMKYRTFSKMMSYYMEPPPL